MHFLGIAASAIGVPKKAETATIEKTFRHIFIFRTSIWGLFHSVKRMLLMFSLNHNPYGCYFKKLLMRYTAVKIACKTGGLGGRENTNLQS
jgi:hypothetical protein